MKSSTALASRGRANRIGVGLERRVALNWSTVQIRRFALLMLSLTFAFPGLVLAAEPTEQVTAPVRLTRVEVGDLLAKARKSMAEGKLAEADAMIRRAEGAKMHYPVLHFGDTPTKVRRDLKKLLGQSGTTLKQVLSTKSALSKKDPFRAGAAAASAAAHVGVPDVKGVATENLKTNLKTLDVSEQNRVQLAAATEAIPVDLTLPSTSPAGENPTGEKPLRLAQLPTREPSQLPSTEEVLPVPVDVFQLLRNGENALREGDRSSALRMFRAAHGRRNELDLLSQQKLQDHLQMLSAGSSRALPRRESGALLNSAATGQGVVARQLSAEIGKRQSEAAALRTKDPQGALKLLKEAGELVSESELDASTKTQLARRVDLSVAEIEGYIRDHGAELELDAANQAVLEDVARQREVKLQVQERLAGLVNQFNTLRDEQRYAGMEVVAKRAFDMAPEEPVAQQIWESAKFIRRSMLNREIDQMTDEGVVGIFQGIRKDAAQGLLDSNTPIRYDAESWPEMVKRTGSSERTNQRTAREQEIHQKLRIPVLPRYDGMPLAEVMQSLSELAGVNIHLDPRGLGQEGVRTDTPVSLNLGQEVSLKSALSLILEPLHLTYMVKDEVLKVTSEQVRDGEVGPRVYNVADLVIPIPNFVPSNNMGLQGLINDAYAALPNVQRSGGGPIAYVPGQAPVEGGGPANPNVLQQPFGTGGGGGMNSGSNALSGGPGGLGGAAQADFDSLIDLIVSTVEHDTWMENGTGQGEIQPFPTNLSLVISQTQRVHEQIADLLEQLRRLQDLQVTIEVRFIRLTDNFFERIGIDFDFNIEDGSGTAMADLNNVGASFEPGRRSGAVGISGGTISNADNLPDFTVDLDIPFRNSSFGLTVPQFGGPGPAATPVGQFGFAILSDIEAFFLIEASQGDSRANVLQAPKVTLFNGQQAIIVDTAFTPFVISVIPVVGEFAAAQQPVIVVLSEGTMMTVQAVVSDDRRYVRLTLVPFFSQIGEVNTFTFEGSQTTTNASNTTDQDDDGNNENDDNARSVVTSGTTVQLPTFEVISVATTVSVPDGGTVLLGGIKRLREGRNEFGVPLLSKLPYIDRLFRNVGIGRETDSLMMMVTPHIIIQEEEEERLGISP